MIERRDGLRRTTGLRCGRIRIAVPPNGSIRVNESRFRLVGAVGAA
jgi:hypothetical protein